MKTEAPELLELLAREQTIRRETEILRDANEALTQNLSLERVLETLLDFLGKLVPYDSANVMLRNGDSKIVVSALRRYEPYQDVEITRTIAFDENANSLLRQLCQTKQTVVVPDTHLEPAWQLMTGAEHVRNWMGVPLVVSGKVIGLYSVDKVTPGFFQAEHERLAESLAARAASAIQNAQLFETLRESEERYRELFENAKDAIYVHDLDGTLIRINHAAEEMSGYSREEIVGHNFTEFIAKEHFKLVRQNFCAKLARVGQTSYEVDVIAKDGRRVPVEVSSRAIYENGVLVGVQGMARDITERKLAQDALQMFSRQLIEAQEDERRRISRELHDQIGQILTAVKMNLYTVQQVCKTSEAGSCVKDNIEAVDEALRLVRDLSVDLRPPMLDDLGLVTALQWYVDRYLRRTGLSGEVIIDLRDHNERFSRERETACFRIAQEALSNIARHAQASQIQVQLAKDGNVLLLIVKDDGVGFDLESLRKRATLGLVSMQERAHAAGGAIEIDSARSRGTEVRFTLPLES
jgi:PAS domain S-box-containing protein